MFILRFLRAVLDRIFVIIGAVIFSQAPLFMQQYTQQLSGHTAELQLQVDAMRQAASHSGKTLQQYIQKFIDNPDMDFSRQGEIMSAMVERWHALTEGLRALQSSTTLTRPYAFITHFNADIAKSAWNAYSFGLPLDLEGVTYAALGALLGYGIFLGICRVCGRIVALFRVDHVQSPT